MAEVVIEVTGKNNSGPAQEGIKGLGAACDTTKRKVLELIEGLTGFAVLEKSAGWLKQNAGATIMFAASMEQADRALEVIGNTTGHTAAVMYKYRDAVRDMNITTAAATNATTQFARAGLDMNHLTTLAKGAQGAAIAYNMLGREQISSSEAYDKMIRAILTGQTIELHELGIMVSQREIMRENDKGITEHQRHQLLLGQTLKELEPLNTLYANSLDLASKKISSSKRPVEELKLALGGLFLPILNEQATAFYNTVKWGMDVVKDPANKFAIAGLTGMFYELYNALKLMIGFAAAYFVVLTGAGWLTGAMGAAYSLSAAWATLGATVTLTGKAAQVATLSIYGTGTAATVAATSIKGAFLPAVVVFMAAYEATTLLYKNLEFVRDIGTSVVVGLMMGWHGLVTLWKEGAAIVANMFNWEQMEKDLSRIQAESEAWHKRMSEIYKGALADNGSGPNPANTANAFADDQKAIAKGLENRHKLEAEAGAKTAAQQQADHEKYLKQQQETHVKYLAYSKAFDDRLIAQVKAQSGLELAELEDRHSQGLISEQVYLENKLNLETKAVKAELQIAQKAHDEAIAVKAKADRELEKSGNRAPSKAVYDIWLETAKEVEATGQAVDGYKEKLAGLEQKQGFDLAKLPRDLKDQWQQLNIELLKTKGSFIEAAAAQDTLNRTSAEYLKLEAAAKEGDTTAQRILAIKEETSALAMQASAQTQAAAGASAAIAEYETQLTVIGQLEKTNALNSTDAAKQKIELLQKEKDEYQKIFDSIQGNLPADLSAKQQTLDKIIAINGKLLEQQEIAGGFDGGLQAGIDAYVKNLDNGFAKGKALASEAANAMQGFFTNVFNGKIKEGWKGLMESLKSMWAKTLAEMATKKLMLSVGLTSGSASSSSGVTDSSASGSWLSSAASLAGYGGAGYGIGSAIGGSSSAGYGGMAGGIIASLAAESIAVAGGALAGAIGSAIGTTALLNVVIPGLGILVGALIGSLFSGSKDLPELTFQKNKYTENYKGQTGNYQDGAWNLNTTAKGYTFGQQELGLDNAAMSSINNYFETTSETVKTAFEGLGLDVSGFAKEWSGSMGDLGSLTSEELTAKVKEFTSSYISFATGIDFSKFQASGETVTETITKIATAMSYVASLKAGWDTETKTGWDIKSMYDNIDISANTYKETLTATDKSIAEGVTELNSLSGAEWATQLETVGGLIQSRYDQEIKYLTYIKQFSEDAAKTVSDNIESWQTSSMDIGEKAGHYLKKAAEGWAEVQAEADPTKLKSAFTSTVTAINNLYNALKTLQSAVDSVADSAKSTKQTLYLQTLTDEEKNSYYNDQAKKAWDSYNKTKSEMTAYYQQAMADGALSTEEASKIYNYAQTLKTSGQTILDLVSSATSGLSQADAKATYANISGNLDTITTDMTTVSDWIGAQTSTYEDVMTTLNTTIQDKLVTAISLEIAALNSLRDTVGGIAWSNLTGTSTSTNSATSAAPVAAQMPVRAAGSGAEDTTGKTLADLDARLASIEALLSRQQPVDVTVNLQGDAGPIITKAATEGANLTINRLNNNPALLRYHARTT